MHAPTTASLIEGPPSRHAPRTEGDGTPTGSTSPSTAVRLVGRTDELDRLTRFVDSLSFSGGSAALVGEPGIGKTALVEATEAMARDRGMLVLSTTGRRLAYTGLARLLATSDRFSDLTELHREALRRAMRGDLGIEAVPLVLYNAMLSLLALTASVRPVLLVIDGFDDVDEATVNTLAFLTRRPGSARVGILLAGTRISPIPVNERIAVDRLSPADAGDLIRSLRPDLTERARAALVDHSEGNPLAILEQLRLRERVSAGETDAGMPNVARLRVSADTMSTFSRQLGRLPSATRQALLVVALGRAGNLRSLAAAGIEVDALDPAEEGGLVRIHSGSLTATFIHPLIPSLVMAGASADELREAHLAHASSGSGTVEAAAIHLAEASTAPDEVTAAMLERVASLAVARGDSGAATDLMARAGRLSPYPADRRRRLARAALLATNTLAEHRLSSQLLDESRAGSGDAGSAYSALADAFGQLSAGKGSRASSALIRDAVMSGSHGWNAANAELIDAMRAWLLMCWTAGREQEWTEYFSALERLHPAAPEPLRTLSIAFADAAHATPWDRMRVTKMLADLGPDDDPEYILQTLTAALFFDQSGDGIWAAWQMLRSGRATEGTLTRLRAVTLIALHDVEVGRWQEAEQLLSEGLTAAAASSDSPVVGMLFYVKALLEAVRGNAAAVDDCTRLVDDFAEHLESDSLRRFAARARAVAAAGRGDWEEAYRQTTTISAAGRFEAYAPHAISVAFELVASALRTGRIVEAGAHHRAMLDAGLTNHSPRMAMLTAAAGAMVERGDGWDREFMRALAVTGAERSPFDHARVRYEYAVRLRLSGRSSEARDQLEQAAAVFERLGAMSWQRLTAQEILAAGSGLTSTTARQDLTAQELAIAELAAQGLTNKEIGHRLFLSARTVSGHLYHAFPKLGITKRSSLRDALSRLQREDDRAFA